MMLTFRQHLNNCSLIPFGVVQRNNSRHILAIDDINVETAAIFTKLFVKCKRLSAYCIAKIRSLCVNT